MQLPEVRADLVRRIENAQTDFTSIEVPNDTELISLHSDTVRMLDAAANIAREMEGLNMTSVSSLKKIYALMDQTQALLGRLESDIFPRIQEVATTHQYDLPTSLGDFVN